MQETIRKIKQLKKEKNALIIAHNYQAVEVQEIADYRGDSLQLAYMARDAKSPIVVFCGVRFMAETAAILNRDSRILLPVLDAGCPMADMITAEQLREFKAKHPDSVVVCYVNSSVEVKAESDVCCTSSNAVKILANIPKDQKILFVPDRNLGSWAARQTGRDVITWDGYCPTHQWGFSTEDIIRIKKEYPDHPLLAHPECDKEIVDEADFVLSTGGMIDYAKNHDKAVIATENGLTDYLNHLYPEKSFITLSPRAICQNMKKTHLTDVLHALETENYHIAVDDETAIKAGRCIDRMFELSK